MSLQKIIMQEKAYKPNELFYIWNGEYKWLRILLYWSPLQR